jgi:hypothetical protein
MLNKTGEMGINLPEGTPVISQIRIQPRNLRHTPKNPKISA